MTTTLLLVALATGAVSAPQAARGGAACAMAKWQGNTLDYALATAPQGPAAAKAAAEQQLKDKGFDRYPPHNVSIIHHQAATGLPHAHAVVIRSDHRTRRGRPRTSYGCGFSAVSFDDALWAAIRDLQNHSWGWKPDRDGYEVVERTRY